MKQTGWNFLAAEIPLVNPKAMDHTGPLSGSQGSVLDPIVAIRYKIKLEPEESITIDLILGIGDTREICDKLIEKYRDKHHKDRVFELAWTHSQVILRQIKDTEADEQLFGRLAGSVIFTLILPCAQTLRLLLKTTGGNQVYGVILFRVICQSYCCK